MEQSWIQPRIPFNESLPSMCFRGSPVSPSHVQKFYLDLRKQRRHTDSTPITTRQLESLIRLTEARARVELREEATAQDARDVVEVMKFSMHDTFSDQYGMLDFDRSQHGSGMSQRAQVCEGGREGCAGKVCESF